MKLETKIKLTESLINGHYRKNICDIAKDFMVKNEAEKLYVSFTYNDDKFSFYSVVETEGNNEFLVLYEVHYGDFIACMKL